MSPVGHTTQAAAVDVAVELRRRKRAVPEELLDRAQIRATLEQMRRERMPQAVRMGKDAAKRRGVQAPTACREEHGVLRTACELGASLVQIPREDMRRLFAQRDDPLFPTFATDMELLAVEVDVCELEPDGLRASKPGGIDQLDERPIPQRERPVSIELVESGFHLGCLGTVRQPPR
jgi:hypothetical protein